MAFRKALSLGCDSHQHHSRLLRRFAARGRGEVAEMAATRKCQKYSELSTAYMFLPIAVEILGPTNDLARFFEILGHKIIDVSGDSRKVSFLFQRMSVIIQRFNAALFHDMFTLHHYPDI